MIAATTHMLISVAGRAPLRLAPSVRHGCNMLDQQSTMLAYIDNFWLLAVAVLIMIPFVS